MSTGDITWTCPYCKKVYYTQLSHQCTCEGWTRSRYTETQSTFSMPTDAAWIENVKSKLESNPKLIIEKDIPSSNLKLYSDTLVVNLFAGPGAGKSTTAAGIFYDLKTLGINCEIATEYAKDLAWEERHKTFEDQIYIFGKQYHRIYRLIGNVSVIITDSPILLTPVYDPEKRTTLEKLAVEEHNKMWTLNIFLLRTKGYNPKGRNQSETEAIKLDREILNNLNKHKVNYELFEGNSSGKDDIVKQILQLIK